MESKAIFDTEYHTKWRRMLLHIYLTEWQNLLSREKLRPCGNKLDCSNLQSCFTFRVHLHFLIFSILLISIFTMKSYFLFTGLVCFYIFYGWVPFPLNILRVSKFYLLQLCYINALYVEEKENMRNFFPENYLCYHTFKVII